MMTDYSYLKIKQLQSVTDKTKYSITFNIYDI